MNFSLQHQSSKIFLAFKFTTCLNFKIISDYEYVFFSELILLMIIISIMTISLGMEKKVILILSYLGDWSILSHFIIFLLFLVITLFFFSIDRVCFKNAHLAKQRKNYRHNFTLNDFKKFPNFSVSNRTQKLIKIIFRS